MSLSKRIAVTGARQDLPESGRDHSILCSLGKDGRNNRGKEIFAAIISAEDIHRAVIFRQVLQKSSGEKRALQLSSFQIVAKLGNKGNGISNRCGCSFLRRRRLGGLLRRASPSRRALI